MAAKPGTVPPTAERVSARTSDRANQRIRRETEATVAYFADHSDAIGGRLAELDREWDIERVLQTQAAALTLSGLLFGSGSRRALIIPMLVSGFLLQHALQGWCPPVPILRSLGVRTAREIHLERGALKYLRGDFLEQPPTTGSARDRARHALALVER